MAEKKLILVMEDEIRCSFIGMDKEHLRLFVEAYSLFAPNYFFNPQYKLGNWDGRIRFFTWNGQTYNTLLPEILPSLSKLGYTVEVKDLREAAFFKPAPITEDYFSHVETESGEPIKLRDYQVNFVNQLMAAGNGIGVAATSAGKTFICGALCDSYAKVGATSIVIVPNTDLIRQTRKEFAFLGIETGEYSGKTKDTNGKMIVISTWQALKNNPTIVTDRDVVLVDETHGARGNALQTLLNTNCKNTPHRFGVTGTMPEHPSEELAVRCSIGPILDTISAAQLIDRGVLATLEINVLQLKVDLKKQYEAYVKAYTSEETDETVEVAEVAEVVSYQEFVATYFADYSSEKKFLSKDEDRLNWLSGQVQTRRHAGNVLALVNSVAMGKALAAITPNSHFVYGDDDDKVREEAYALFKSNDDVVVYATYGIASTGLSINRIHELFLFDIGKSFIRVIQSIGRGLRKAEDKSHINVWDICSDLPYSKKHLTKRKAMYKKAGYPHKVKKVDLVVDPN